MKVECPVCHKRVTWEENPYRPFCSEPCKLIDLGDWASERYRVKGESVESEASGGPEEDDEGSGKSKDEKS